MAPRGSKNFDWIDVLRAWNTAARRRKGLIERLTTFHRLVVPITSRYAPIPTLLDPTPLLRWWPREKLEELLECYGNERSGIRPAHGMAPGIERTAEMMHEHRANPELLAVILLAAVCWRSRAALPESWGPRARQAMAAVLEVSLARPEREGAGGWPRSTQYVLPTQESYDPQTKVPGNRLDMVAVAVEELLHLTKHWQIVEVVFEPQSPEPATAAPGGAVT